MLNFADTALSLFADWSQASRIMRLHTSLDESDGPDALMAEMLQAVEGVSPVEEGAHADAGIAGFRLALSCLSLNAHIELKKLMGQPVLLELETDGGRPRAFHGHVTHAEIVGANGGMARYRLTIEPWLSFLRYRRDSAVYQDMSVPDIIESVFRDYAGQGRLQPDWKLDLFDAGVYAKRSLAIQYQETDLHFIHRLMAEEGLFFYIEHEGDPDSPGLGRHTVIVTDHNGGFRPNARAAVEFTQPGATMTQDSIDRWRSVRRWQTNAVEIASWDYRQAAERQAVAASAGDNGSSKLRLTSRDAPGAYASENRAQAERQAANQLQAIEARNKMFTGGGTVRTFAPGTTFTLSGHPDHNGGDSSNFAILRVVHQAHNNLSASLKSIVGQALGEVGGEGGDGPADASIHERPVYRNRIEAIRAAIPYRPAALDALGAAIHPKPTVFGQQSAIVVGAEDSPVHTDRDHRIKVQFHWQRGERSHNRLLPTTPDGHSGAPADDRAGTWVRVMAGLAPAAGANWGGHAVPRVGQEALIDFIEGDIDRPVVIGTLYNGKGQPDAQDNQSGNGAGASTGNAPAWFPGQADGYGHAAVLSGIKTQAMGASQNGAGAYNQLVFDDAPGQSRASLQQHANAHDGATELNLGQLRQQTDSQRLAQTGFGFEMKTQNSAALRAGKGMLISTEAAPGGAGPQLDSRGAQSLIGASHQRQIDLATLAQKQNAVFGGEAGPEKLGTVAQTAHSAEVIAARSDSGSAGPTADHPGDGGDSGGSGGNGNAIGFTEPQLQLSSPSGIAALTPASAILASAKGSSITAAHDINFAAQGNAHYLAASGIVLFTYGKAASAGKPNQETGIAMHAASGKVSMQSQSGATGLTASGLITVASVAKDVRIAAHQHVMLTAQGAYLKLEGGNIDIHGPGAMTFKAAAKELTGPADGSAPLPRMPAAKPPYDEAFKVVDHESGEPVKYVNYRIENGKGETIGQGITDELGHTERSFTGAPEDIKIFLGED
ncbi:MAG TPA: type VI secretion system tip protein TssI/VgrG [Herbaspirillum sp.]|jgi:type VI secretion system VgrG family protein